MEEDEGTIDFFFSNTAVPIETLFLIRTLSGIEESREASSHDIPLFLLKH
jgi:hypothetical protein